MKGNLYISDMGVFAYFYKINFSEYLILYYVAPLWHILQLVDIVIL